MEITVVASTTQISVKWHAVIWILCLTALLPVSGVLETTPAAVDGKLITCDGNRISLTCTHSSVNIGRTRWRFSPPIDCSSSFLHDPVPDNIDDCGPFSFKDVTQLTTGVSQLSSTAVATVSSQHTGTLVECSDRSSVSMTNIGNVSLCVIGEPTISQAVNTRDGVKITWSSVSGCTNNVNYSVVVTRQGDAPDNITFSSVVTDSTSVVVANLTDGQDYTVYVTASVRSCNTHTVQKNYTADSSDIPGGDGVGVGNNLGMIVAAVVVPIIVIIAFVTIFAIIVYFYRKSVDNTKHHPGPTEVTSSNKSPYAVVKFPKGKKEQSHVEDSSRVVYSVVTSTQATVTGLTDTAEAQGVNSQEQPASEGRSSSQPAEQGGGHHDAATSSNTRASEASFPYDTPVDPQNGGGIEQPSSSAFGTHKASTEHSTAAASSVAPVSTSTLTAGQYQGDVNRKAGSSVDRPSKQTASSAIHDQTSEPSGIQVSHAVHESQEYKPSGNYAQLAHSYGGTGPVRNIHGDTGPTSHVGTTPTDIQQPSHQPSGSHRRKSSRDTAEFTIPNSGAPQGTVTSVNTSTRREPTRTSTNHGHGSASSTSGTRTDDKIKPVVKQRKHQQGYAGAIATHDSGDNESSFHREVGLNLKSSHDRGAVKHTKTDRRDEISGERQQAGKTENRKPSLPSGGTSAYNRGAGGSLTRSTGGGGHAADRRDKGTFGSSQPRNTGHNPTGRNYY